MRQMIKIFISSLMLAAPAAAQTCMDAQELEASLIDWYGETPVGAQDTDFQVWASETSGTWSMVEYRETGEACVLSTGEGWPKNGPLPTNLMAELSAE
ncbi:hypothetical protein SAMN05421688_2491 [Poseidonocella pacifica]|uniref:S-adenosyl-L-homocysteine hydrolase n=1 Tax=Poseidonocella pacifica TaxID=871651 RepID=A0A1I0XWC7_9RHOB|nr:S-adenosyl-L-homocysteine hydrolase [Poseidonocella pacifica]SFB04468.1 hypothetical protein SAMN05421688_2491 [Poseidonocella pacifica]